MRPIRFHDLRHTCATLLLRQGVHVKYIQELLGYADISLTSNVYSHVLPDMGDAAAGATDDALGRSSVGTVLASVVSEQCQKAPVGVPGPSPISTFYLQIAPILAVLGRTRIFDLTPRWAYCRTEQYNYRFGCSKKGSGSSHAVIEHLTMDLKGLG